MSEVNYQPSWQDETTQCKSCKMFQEKEGKFACVPPGKTFEQAVEEYGEIAPNGHCDFFMA